MFPSLFSSGLVCLFVLFFVVFFFFETGSDVSLAGLKIPWVAEDVELLCLVSLCFVFLLGTKLSASRMLGKHSANSYIRSPEYRPF